MPAVIPSLISEVGHHAFRDPTRGITEDAKVGALPYDTVDITEDNIRDSKYFAWAMSDILKRRSHVSRE
jgi:hypothetical protein